jgi:hypothetical protein
VARPARVRVTALKRVFKHDLWLVEDRQRNRSTKVPDRVTALKICRWWLRDYPTARRFSARCQARD